MIFLHSTLLNDMDDESADMYMYRNAMKNRLVE